MTPRFRILSIGAGALMTTALLSPLVAGAQTDSSASSVVSSVSSSSTTSSAIASPSSSSASSTETSVAASSSISSAEVSSSSASSVHSEIPSSSSSSSSSSSVASLPGAIDRFTLMTPTTPGNVYLPRGGSTNPDVNAGQMIGVYGNNFAPNEAVDLYGGDGNVLATFHADGGGNFRSENALTIPFNAKNSGLHFWLLGRVSLVPVPFDVTVNAFTPTITLSISSVHPGDHFAAKGQNFSPNEPVTLTINGSTAGQMNTDGGGNLNFDPEIVPGNATSLTVTLTGQSTGAVATITLGSPSSSSVASASSENGSVSGLSLESMSSSSVMTFTSGTLSWGQGGLIFMTGGNPDVPVVTFGPQQNMVFTFTLGPGGLQITSGQLSSSSTMSSSLSSSSQMSSEMSSLSISSANSSSSLSTSSQSSMSSTSSLSSEASSAVTSSAASSETSLSSAPSISSSSASISSEAVSASSLSSSSSSVSSAAAVSSSASS